MHRRGKYIVNKDEHCLICCFCSQDSDIKDYQMWVRYGKEDSPYPLIGKFVFTLIIRDFFFLSQLVTCLTRSLLGITKDPTGKYFGMYIS